MKLFAGREDAGDRLGSAVVSHLEGEPPGVVLGLARGGVPVAVRVARALEWPVFPYIVRKLGVPNHPELAFGAVAGGGATILNTDIIERLRISDTVIREVIEEQLEELERRTRRYRGDRPAPSVEGATAVIVDDGAATGASVRVAVSSLRLADPGRIVVALPVASTDAVRLLRAEVDDVVAIATPDPFVAVGAWYERFDQVTDEEVIALLT